MAFETLVERGATRIDGKNSTFEALWQTNGYTDNPSRKTAIQANGAYVSSVTADGYTLDNLNWAYEQQQGTSFLVRITYSHKAGRQNRSQNKVLQNVGDEETRISFSSVDVPVTEAIDQNNPVLGNSPDCGNTIEYNRQTQEVKGTTRKKLVSRLVVTKLYDESTVTESWIKTREDKLFTLNDATFRSRPAETVMFIGMDIQQRADADAWTVTFTFEYMRTETKDLTTLDIGSSDTAYTIYPFRYYWAYYEDEKDTTQNVMVPKCKGFYEAEIYETSDFSTDLI